MRGVLLVLGLLGCVGWLGAAPEINIVTSASVDLNGDGRAEAISIAINNTTGKYTLKIANLTVAGRLEPEIDGFAVVDIDGGDKIKEVAVHTAGPSDDDEYVIYWYTGTAIKPVGDLARWPTFPGGGLVYVRDWMGFWEKTERYVLNKSTHTLQVTPQELYYVGVQAKVKDVFPLYRAKTDGKVIANLRAGSTATILLWDAATAGKTDDRKDWYLVKAESGVVGWAQMRALNAHMELPSAD